MKRLGNWDDFLPDPDRRFDSEALRWWLDQLAPGQGEWLRSLPYAHDFWLSGRRVRLFHASEETDHRRVRFAKDQSEFEALFTATESTGGGELPDVVGSGDTHDPYYETQLEGELDGWEPGTWWVAHVRVPYDVAAELAAARELGMPDYDGYELELRHGLYRRWLDEWRAAEPMAGYHERSVAQAAAE